MTTWLSVTGLRLNFLAFLAFLAARLDTQGFPSQLLTTEANQTGTIKLGTSRGNQTDKTYKPTSVQNTVGAEAA